MTLKYNRCVSAEDAAQVAFLSLWLNTGASSLMKRRAGVGRGRRSSTVRRRVVVAAEAVLSHAALIITYSQTSNVTHNIPRFALHRLLCILRSRRLA